MTWMHIFVFCFSSCLETPVLALLEQRLYPTLLPNMASALKGVTLLL